MNYYDGDRYSNYDEDMEVTYSGTTGANTTCVVLPDPDHRVDVALGDEHLRFTTRDAFEALAKVLGIEAEQ